MLNLPQYIAMINLPHYWGKLSRVSWAIVQIILDGHLKWNFLDWGDEQCAECAGTKISIYTL